MNPPTLITLTTDFGTAGYYVGAMRGVLLSLHPEARLVDITHEVTPYSVLEASWVLSEACPRFPEDTVHLAVVDPGVGGRRKPLIVRSQGHWFVGPDNGLFTPFLEDEASVYRIRDAVALPNSSATFHGRDLFAPAAARLARGEPVLDLAEPVAQAMRLHLPRPRRDGRQVVGQVLYADRFGNLVTNIHRDNLKPEEPWEVLVGAYRIARVARTYQDGSLGESLALFGSSGFLELAVVEGDAAAQLGVGRGERVRVRAPRG